MATVEHGSLLKIGSDPNVAWVCKWEGLNQTDTVGDALEMPAWSDRSVQAVGDFSSGTIALQGSNDGTTWAALQDLEGTAIGLSAEGLVSVLELTRYVRPSLSGADGSDDIDVYLLISGYRSW